MTEFLGYAIRPRRDLIGAGSAYPWGDYLRVFPTSAEAGRNRLHDTKKGDPLPVKLTLPDGAFFKVEGDIDTCEGRGRRSFMGNFLDYWDAYEAAEHQAAQGMFGYISLMEPFSKNTVAVDKSGREVVMSTSTSYRSANPADHILEL